MDAPTPGPPASGALPGRPPLLTVRCAGTWNPLGEPFPPLVCSESSLEGGLTKTVWAAKSVLGRLLITYSGQRVGGARSRRGSLVMPAVCALLHKGPEETQE